MSRTKKTAKKTRPVNSQRQALETAEQDIGQGSPRAMKSTGPARESLEPDVIDPVEGNPERLNEKMKMESFMGDVLTVVVHESSDPSDEPFPGVWNGGQSQYFVRGKEMQVKRKFVEVLARAKKTTFTQKLVKDGNGVDTYMNVPHTSQQYPFAVTNDPAGDIGRAWLKKILAERS